MHGIVNFTKYKLSFDIATVTSLPVYRIWNDRGASDWTIQISKGSTKGLAMNRFEISESGELPKCLHVNLRFKNQEYVSVIVCVDVFASIT